MPGPGAPYPHQSQAPGSNAIGKFQIGISPIGTITPFDVWATIISQYGNSPRLTQLIESFNAAMDPTEFMDSFYDLIWNVATAQGYGLDVWGRIVGVSRTLKVPGAAEYLGFNEAGNSWTGFGQGAFYSGGGISENVVLADTDYRQLILAKAAGNISDGSIPALNAILMNLFRARGDCYVADGLNMTMAYTFSFPLNPIELAIVETTGVLPNPCGVVINVAQP
jgi:hypothetical protein